MPGNSARLAIRAVNGRRKRSAAVRFSAAMLNQIS